MLTDKLKVGIMIDPEYKPEIGGGYSYYSRIVQAINNYKFGDDIEIVNVISATDHSAQAGLMQPCVFINPSSSKSLKETINTSNSNVLKRVLNRNNFFLNLLYRAQIAKNNRRNEQILRNNEIDLIYYLKPDQAALDYPFIATHWDTGHKTMPSFPERSSLYTYEEAERYHHFVLGRAFHIFCESEVGKEELNTYYPAFKEKVSVLPIFAGDVINMFVDSDEQTAILHKHGLLKEQFFLYPAQFWPHKNHYNLLKAFRLFLDKHPGNIKLALPGSDKGNLSYIRQVAEDLLLTKKVIFPGFISQGELFTFYKNAIALVMPTFLGPTNMPLIEAAHLMCPVICSDLEGHREMLGEHALYAPPSHPELIMAAIENIMENGVRKKLQVSAHQHIVSSPFNIDNALKLLANTLNELRSTRRAWGTSF